MKTKQMVDNLGLRVSVYVRACVRMCVCLISDSPMICVNLLIEVYKTNDNEKIPFFSQ